METLRLCRSPWFPSLNLSDRLIQPQAFDVPGVSEYTVASNMARNRIFYIEIRI